MDSTPILILFIAVSLKALSLEGYCFQLISMTSTVQLDIVQFFILQMIQTFEITTIQQKERMKEFNKDLKKLTNWLDANKIYLNINKTEVKLLYSNQ